MFDFNKYKNAPAVKPEAINKRFHGLESLADLRQALEDEGLVLPGFNLTQSDYEAIILRMGVLTDERPGMSQYDALASAYIDRLSILGETGIEMLRMIPVENLQSIFEQKFGENISTDEVEMFFKYLQAGHIPTKSETVEEQWHKAKAVAQSSISISTKTGVLDGEDNVIGMEDGDNSVSALRNARQNTNGIETRPS